MNPTWKTSFTKLKRVMKRGLQARVNSFSPLGINYRILFQDVNLRFDKTKETQPQSRGFHFMKKLSVRQWFNEHQINLKALSL